MSQEDPQIVAFNLGGINLYTNPLIPSFERRALQQDGQIIRAVNVDSFPYGAKVKRPGYTTYLGTPDSGSVYSLFSWLKNDGATLYTYRASGGTLYYSTQGTGAWTVCGNGTVTSGSQVGYSVLNNTLVISQNGGTTRTSTTGTSFTDATAPAGGYLEQYQNKIFLGGTSSVVSASVTGDPTNWATTGTSDGYTVTVPGYGVPNRLFKLSNRLQISMNSQAMYYWDGLNLVDRATNLGLSSPFSYGSVEDHGFWINRLGVMTSSGDQPEMISNTIQRFFYNDNGSAIQGTSFNSAPGVVHRYDYLVSAGSMTDDFTNETVNNGIIKYNFQKNEFLNYTFNDFPTAWHSYRDASGNQQLIFGNSSGQCFTYGNTSLNDNGQPIESIIELMFNFNVPHYKKDWKWMTLYFNPGCEAQILFASSDTFIKEEKVWYPVGDAVEGRVFYRFQPPVRSSLLFIKIVESSRNAKFSFYGMAIGAELASFS